jgi:cob(I)alamin adenosyltransferase
MPRLTKIYTRKGDDGTTSLGDRRRVAKNSLRVEAYGTVDELNSAIGLALALGVDDRLRSVLRSIQDELFDLGADLSFPQGDSRSGLLPKIVPEQVSRLESVIDLLNKELGPLENFILPGGTPSAAALHLARTICRRAERLAVGLSQVEAIGETALPYLNRLSDALFVMARYENYVTGTKETLWGKVD